MKRLYYNTYCSGRSGLSNIIMSIEIGVVMAHLTDRTLVLDGNRSPPANVVDYGNVLGGSDPSLVTDLIDLPVPWVEAEEFDPDELVGSELTDRPLHESVFYLPAELDTSTIDFRAFAHTRANYVTYMDDLCESEVVRMSGGSDGGDMNNLGFYSYLFYLPPSLKRSVHRLLRGMRAKPCYAEFAERIARDLGTFNTVHVRRGDFKVTLGVTTLERRPREALDVLEHHFDRDDKLVILTDEADDPFFDEIKRRYEDHLFIDHFILDNYRDDFLDLPQHDSLALAYLSQLVAAHSNDFVGSMTSTFTSMIQRYRGNAGRPEPFKFLWNEIPDREDKLERGRHPISDCVPMRHGIMVEEYPGPYTWNRYNPRINPAWMREWPEAFLGETERDDQEMRPDARGLSRPSGDARESTMPWPLLSPAPDRLFVSFGGHQVAISSRLEEARRVAHRQFRDMIVPSAGDVIGTLEIDGRGGQYRFVREGRPYDDTVNLANLPTRLTREIVRMFISANSDLIWLHAGAVSHDDKAIIFPGRWGRGKSTLVTELAKRGWSFHSDDILPIDPRSWMAWPFPQTPRLRQGSGNPVSRNELGGMRKNNIDIPTGSISRRPVPLAMLVLPDYDPAFDERLTPHSPAAAVAELLEGCLSFVDHREPSLTAMCALVERLPTYRLTYSDGRRAADLVADAYAELNRGGKLQDGS
jgi:hypothetical protein